MRKIIVAVFIICFVLGLAGPSVAKKRNDWKLIDRVIEADSVFRKTIGNSYIRFKKFIISKEANDPPQHSIEATPPPQDSVEVNDGRAEVNETSQETVAAANPPETEVVETDKDTASVPGNTSDNPPLIGGSCEWSEGRNSLDMQSSVPGYLSASWSATENVGQSGYTGAAKFKVFDVAVKGGSTEDVVVDIDLREIDSLSQPWTELNGQEQAAILVYDDDGSKCITPAYCNARLMDIHSAIDLALIEKYPGGYTIEGDASFLGVFIKNMEGQDDPQEICGFCDVPEENDTTQDGAEGTDTLQETTEVVDQTDTEINDSTVTDDSAASTPEFNANANTITASSCNLHDVEEAVSAANDGDSILIPAGSCIWSNTLIVPETKSLTITGAGIGNTIIYDNLNDDPLIVIRIGTGTTDISNISFDGNSSTSGGIGDAIIKIVGVSNDNSNIRIHHINFNNYAKRAIVVSSGKNEVYAVIDNCTFSTSHRTQTIAFVGQGQNSTWWWDNVSSELGTADFNFVEDCSFDYTGPSVDNAVDMYGGSKAVVRYNTFRNIRMSFHGTDSGNYVSPLAWEFYENTHLNHRQSTGGEGRAFASRGGTGVVYNNTWESGYKNTLIIQLYRAAKSYGNWGMCDGSSSWDQNIEPNGYPCLGQHGRGSDTTGSRKYPSEPLYEWNNSTNGIDTDWKVVGNSTHLKENRDYFNDKIKSGYTAYTYPHPLTKNE